MDGRTEGELLEHRLDLLRRETANLGRARRILAEIEASGESSRDAILRESRRTLELAAQAQRLGVRDAHRVGATIEQLVDATGLDASAIAAALDAE